MFGKNIIRVLFVCLGNICRSPMAEAIMTHLVAERGLSERFKIQSAGIGAWHIGDRPHSGTVQILKQHHIAIHPSKRAQQIKPNLFSQFDFVIAMDHANKTDLKAYGNASLLLDEVPSLAGKDVPDPYYEKNFDMVYELVLQGCSALLDRICKENDIF